MHHAAPSSDGATAPALGAALKQAFYAPRDVSLLVYLAASVLVHSAHSVPLALLVLVLNGLNLGICLRLKGERGEGWAPAKRCRAARAVLGSADFRGRSRTACRGAACLPAAGPDAAALAPSLRSSAHPFAAAAPCSPDRRPGQVDGAAAGGAAGPAGGAAGGGAVRAAAAGGVPGQAGRHAKRLGWHPVRLQVGEARRVALEAAQPRNRRAAKRLLHMCWAVTHAPARPPAPCPSQPHAAPGRLAVGICHAHGVAGGGHNGPLHPAHPHGWAASSTDAPSLVGRSPAGSRQPAEPSPQPRPSSTMLQASRQSCAACAPVKAREGTARPSDVRRRQQDAWPACPASPTDHASM